MKFFLHLENNSTLWFGGQGLAHTPLYELVEDTNVEVWFGAAAKNPDVTKDFAGTEQCGVVGKHQKMLVRTTDREGKRQQTERRRASCERRGSTFT
jgi:hypothetical protein